MEALALPAHSLAGHRRPRAPSLLRSPPSPPRRSRRLSHPHTERWRSSPAATRRGTQSSPRPSPSSRPASPSSSSALDPASYSPSTHPSCPSLCLATIRPNLRTRNPPSPSPRWPLISLPRWPLPPPAAPASACLADPFLLRLVQWRPLSSMPVAIAVTAVNSADRHRRRIVVETVIVLAAHQNCAESLSKPQLSSPPIELAPNCR